MKNFTKIKAKGFFSKTLFFLILSSLLLILSCNKEDTIENEEPEQIQEIIPNIKYSSTPIEGQYIIEYNNSTERISKLNKVRSSSEYKAQENSLRSMFSNKFSLNSEDILSVYGHTITGFTAKLSTSQLKKLEKDPRIKSIEKDAIIGLGKPQRPMPIIRPRPSRPIATPTQVTPYGTTRVGGGVSGSSHVAWVIDTGIDLDHPDLNVDVYRSISFLSGAGSNRNPEDKNGHGTHVAGTIAAIDNNFGTLGVAPGSLVVAVRVLDRRGQGYVSGVIAGVDYAAANASSGDVANMSLGGGASTSLDNAIVAAASTGLKFALAAGNESDDADYYSPARVNHPNVYTISAMDSYDNWASFSNYGASVDYCAPGVGIYSTWLYGRYNTLNGTSMATPHATGVLLLGSPSSDGTVAGDPDGSPDPIIHTL